ncbi:MAG: DJ-1/PfpI family protein [Alphaproteobacteria bacterium]|nr:DJ-1/PfpI family protein [Alphaproteobacteria bacterium]
MSNHSTTILFALYPGATQLDFTGPHQVFSRLPGTKVLLASTLGGEVEADGIRFGGLAKLAEVPSCDVICVPGGAGTTDNAIADRQFLKEVGRLAAAARFVTSVCTGSLVLGAAGLLVGKRAACHWAWRSLLEPFGAIPDESRVVRDGNLITGGGVTAGIDFALTLAAELAGPDVAQAIQLGLEYAPAPPFNAGLPELAPPHVLDLVQRRMSAAAARRRDAVRAAAARL